MCGGCAGLLERGLLGKIFVMMMLVYSAKKNIVNEPAVIFYIEAQYEFRFSFC